MLLIPVPVPVHGSVLQGRTVSFKNTIIIMTSNLGSASLLEEYVDKDIARSLVLNAVRAHFRPEFINRIDELIVFDPLEQEQIKQIVKLQVKRVAERLQDKKIALDVRESAVNYLAKVGFDPVYGARPVKRAVQRELETALAKAILRGDIVDEDTVVVEAGPQGLVFSKGTKVDTPVDGYSAVSARR